MADAAPAVDDGTSIFDQKTLPMILCCLCGITIPSNPANMCVNCVRSQVDITAGIPKQILINFCRGCGRYLSPPNAWIAAALESRELLSYCLKRIRGLNKVKLIDAGFVWTEPHSKRLKVKLKIQQEVFHSTILEQTFIVTFVVQGLQCDQCRRSDTDHTWNAVVQLRQKVEHKRTFYFLEQVILKHDAHAHCLSIKEYGEGLDFYFANKSKAIKLSEFISSISPTRVKTAKRLISQDIHSNTYYYKYTLSQEIAPICKDDLLCLPRAIAQSFGGINPILLCHSIHSSIHAVDPTTLQTMEINATAFWKSPFRPVLTRQQLTQFIVLDVTPITDVPIPRDAEGRWQLADVEVARESDFGSCDTTFLVRSHLGNLLKSGDNVLGYDLLNANYNEADVEAMRGRDMPDIIIVRKCYPHRRAKRNRRKWRLKSLDKEKSDTTRRTDLEKEEADYEVFLRDVEEDPELRQNINIYKVAGGDEVSDTGSEMSDEEVEDIPEIPIDEMIEEIGQLDIQDETE